MKKHPRFFRWFLKKTDFMKGPNDVHLDHDIEQFEFYLKGFYPLFISILRRKIWRFFRYWGWLRLILRAVVAVIVTFLIAGATYYTTVYYIKPIVSPNKVVVKEIYTRNLKSFSELVEVVGKRESGNNWEKQKGQYHGYFQFGEEAFKACKKAGLDIDKLGKDNFLSNEDLQRVYFKELLRLNRRDLQKYIDKYDMTDQKFVKGTITESGILMAAHLRGSESVKMFFDSKGKANLVDGNGTSVKDYIEEFSGYKLNI